MNSVRTDLAVEARELYNEHEKQKDADIPGVEVDTSDSEAASVVRVRIATEEAAKNLGKPVGTYITITSESIKTGDNFEELCKILSDELLRLYPSINKDSVTLVAGLGNWNVTPDSVGPKVVSSILVTRHLYQTIPEHIDERMRPVCAIAPGVLGLTGIETMEIIQSVVQKVKPDAVIVIDALAARKAERVSTTIQLSDTGISPGSGVNNKRLAISRDTLGVPVIAVGIPTVSDAATIVYDAIEEALLHLPEDMPAGSKNRMVESLLAPYGKSLMVTPKDIDMIVKRASNIIAGGINMAIHNGLSIEEISAYTS